MGDYAALRLNGDLPTTMKSNFRSASKSRAADRNIKCSIKPCFRIGSKFRCLPSTPTEMQSMSEKDFECLARTGVKSRRTVFPKSAFGSPNLTFAPRLFDWPRTSDEDIHQSPGALLPLRTGRNMGDADQRPK